MANYERGSEWRKWDLHIHTPFSEVNFYQGLTQEEKWNKFFQDLENLPVEFKVLGINDYLFIDGYEKVLEYKKRGGLPNIETIFPVVEFRIKKFAGHKDFKRVNFHVIFSDGLSPEKIKAQFLNSLEGSYKLSPGINEEHWNGTITKESLSDLGAKIKESVPVEKRGDYGSDFEEGFNNLNLNEDDILKKLRENTYLKDNYLTAVGKTEWESLSWNDQSIAEKKDAINKVDLVFISSHDTNSFENARKKLIENNVNSILLDCSDAHYNTNSDQKDRIGKCLTWIKADPTFNGLRQILIEPERLFVGDKPEILNRISNSPTKYISELIINKISAFSETWFENFSLKLNPGLVAIIGNKGNGKSAVADIIGLSGNTHNENFSFLDKRKFRNPVPLNRANYFLSSLVWHNDIKEKEVNLNSNSDKNDIEKVKYIPQNFLEKLCVNEDEKEFEQELKKIIFSHTPENQKLGRHSLDEIISFRSEIINKEGDRLKKQIEGINSQIVVLEKKKSESYKKSIENFLEQKNRDLKIHESTIPDKVSPPEENEEEKENSSKINNELDKKRNSLEEIKTKIEELRKENSNLSIDVAELQKLKQAFISLEKSIKNTREEQATLIAKHNINIEKLFSYKLDTKQIDTFIEKKEARKTDIESKLRDEDSPEHLNFLKKTIEKEINELEAKLNEPARRYQKYKKDYKIWEDKKNEILGDKEKEGTIKYYEFQIKYINNDLIPEILELESKRKDYLKELFSKKKELVELYSELFKPVSDFINNYKTLKNDYKINLDVSCVFDSFIEKFFAHVSQGAKGSFIGKEDGAKHLQDIIDSHDINEESGLIKFIETILDNLKNDKRESTNIAREISAQLKKGYSVTDLYNFLFCLDYVKPMFKLGLGDKELKELSPGERGALLLIFYLFLDKDDIPLIIDQPEENLDNQSVYDYLVHFIKEAKNRRQIIIITHNPNLAVVCNADQIVHMKIAKENKNEVSFKAGSIENPEINKSIVDILEGTFPAFNNRKQKYLDKPIS